MESIGCDLVPGEMSESLVSSCVTLKFLLGRFKHEYVTFDPVRQCYISSHALKDSLLFVEGKSVVHVVAPEFQVR